MDDGGGRMLTFGCLLQSDEECDRKQRVSGAQRAARSERRPLKKNNNKKTLAKFSAFRIQYIVNVYRMSCAQEARRPLALAGMCDKIAR